MASLGACYIVSINRVAEQEAIVLPDFTIQITSTSSVDLPIRMARMDVVIKGLLPTDKDKSEQIVKQAKAMCTVGNTLNCNITTVLEQAMFGTDYANQHSVSITSLVYERANSATFCSSRGRPPGLPDCPFGNWPLAERDFVRPTIIQSFL